MKKNLVKKVLFMITVLLIIVINFYYISSTTNLISNNSINSLGISSKAFASGEEPHEENWGDCFICDWISIYHVRIWCYYWQNCGPGCSCIPNDCSYGYCY